MRTSFVVGSFLFMIVVIGCEPTPKHDAGVTKTIDLVQYLGLNEATHVLNASREQKALHYWMHPLSDEEKELYRKRLRRLRVFRVEHHVTLVNHARDAYLRFYSGDKPAGPWFFQRWLVPYPPKFKDIGIGIIEKTPEGLNVLVSQSKTQEIPYGIGGTAYAPKEIESLPDTVKYGSKETELPFGW